MPRYTKSFVDTYGDAEVKGFCGPANVLERKILNNELDFAFSEGISSDPAIESKAYMHDHLVVFAANDGRYKNGQRISAEEFLSNRFILREFGSGTRKVFDLACEKAGFTVEPYWESMSNTSIINAVAEGLGIGVLSWRLVTDAVNESRIVTLEVENLDLNRMFYVIYHKDKKLSQAAKYFLYLCSETEFDIPESI